MRKSKKYNRHKKYKLKKRKYKPKINGRGIFGKSFSTLKNLGSLWYVA